MKNKHSKLTYLEKTDKQRKQHSQSIYNQSVKQSMKYLLVSQPSIYT